MQDFFVSLFMFFLVEPIQADLNEKMAAMNVPAAVSEQVTQCATSAAPALADRAMSDPWWGVTTIVGVWTGFNDPIATIGEAAPVCGQMLKGANVLAT